MVNNPHLSFEGEEAGEKVLFMVRPHVITNLGWVLVTIFLLVVPWIVLIILAMFSIDMLVPINTFLLIVATWSLVVLGGAFLWLLHWFFNIYILTNRRVVDIDFAGLFRRTMSQAPLRNIEDVTFTKNGLFPNFFDYGDLHIQTAGALPNFEFYAIPDPEGSLKEILDLVAKVKRGEKGYGDHFNWPDDRSN